MNEFLSLPCPAKLNLFLRVTGRRPDGYHQLQTVFQLLDWGDELRIRTRADGQVRQLRAIPGVPPDQDLSVRAARLLQKSTGMALGADIALHKQIPQGSGLGGASSNAASVLLALNHLWSCGLSPRELAGLGLQLGADVPVFVLGRSAWAEGVGEELVPLELNERWYVLVFGPQSMSTAAVFANAELPRDARPLRREDFAPAWDFSDLPNDCESVVCSAFPGMAEWVSGLRRFGKIRMSGTGSTFFFSADDKNHANQLTTALKNNYNVRAVRGLNKSPVVA